MTRVLRPLDPRSPVLLAARRLRRHPAPTTTDCRLRRCRPDDSRGGPVHDHRCHGAGLRAAPGRRRPRAEHLYVALAGRGRVSRTGPPAATGSQGGSGPSAAVARAGPGRPLRQGPAAAPASTTGCASRERELSQQPAVVTRLSRADVRAAVAAAAAGGRPERTFKVCAHHDRATASSDARPPPRSSPSGWRSISTTPRRAAATPTDLQDVGALFDDHLYPIDTDGLRPGVRHRRQRRRHRAAHPAHQRAVARLQHDRQRHPRLSSSAWICCRSRTLERRRGLLRAVPAPTSRPALILEGGRHAGRSRGVFIHEFQHMISFNQHVLERGRRRRRTPGSTRGCPTSPRSWAAAWCPTAVPAVGHPARPSSSATTSPTRTVPGRPGGALPRGAGGLAGRARGAGRELALRALAGATTSRPSSRSATT